MEQQIQDLINSIRKDGIESAANESRRIIEEAEKKAEKIVCDAHSERDRLLSDAEKEIAKEKKSLYDSLSLAARDLSLSFKKETERKIQKILDDRISASFDSELLKELIKTVVGSLTEGVDVVLPEEKRDSLSSSLLKELTSSLSGGSILYSSEFSGGFRVIEKNGGAYIDVSDEEVSKLLYPYLSSSIRKLI